MTEPEAACFLFPGTRRALHGCNFPPTRPRSHAVTSNDTQRPLEASTQCKRARPTLSLHKHCDPPSGTPCPFPRAPVTAGPTHLPTGCQDPRQHLPHCLTVPGCPVRPWAVYLGVPQKNNQKMTASMQFRERRKLAIFRLFSGYVCILCGKCRKTWHVDIRGLTLSSSSGKISVTLLFAVNSEFKARVTKQTKINVLNAHFLENDTGM